MRLLLLGGSSEGRLLAERLARAGHTVIYSTRTPVAPIDGCRMLGGGFSGANKNGIEGLTDYARRNKTELILDATHPYAAQISEHARQAAKKIHIPYWRYQRRGWQASVWQWREWRDWPELLTLLSPFHRPFLSTGASALEHIDRRPQHQHWIIRSILKHPSSPGITCLTARGPFKYADELRLFQELRPDALICKNSGGTYTRAKLEAARTLGLPILVQRRPKLPKADRVFQNPETLVAALMKVEV